MKDKVRASFSRGGYGWAKTFFTFFLDKSNQTGYITNNRREQMLLTYRNGFEITFHDCGANSYYRARNGLVVYTRKNLQSLLRFVETK